MTATNHDNDGHYNDRHKNTATEMWPSLSTLWPSLTWFVAVIVCGRHCRGRHCLRCGRHGHGLWPSWFVAVIAHRVAVTDSLCGRHCLWPSLSTLWPSWFVAVIV